MRGRTRERLGRLARERKAGGPPPRRQAAKGERGRCPVCRSVMIDLGKGRWKCAICDERRDDAR